jgi:shikimate kinase/3-dehydroquinate synthase
LPDGAHNALDRHLVLVGFMGAGKTTVGAEVARRLARPFLDIDEAIEETHGPIRELFERVGEPAFREIEATLVKEACGLREPSVVAVGGGAVETQGLLESLDAFVVVLDVDVETAWERAHGSGRPLAEDESEFRRRYELRRPLYEQVAQAGANDADGVVLGAAGIRFSSHREAQGSAVVADERVVELHGIDATHVVPRGEKAKTVAEAERLWRSLRLERSSTLVAVGGGSTTDLAGFVAATLLRGVGWIPVPSTLVGQVDAAIGGKTAIDLPQAKNLVGAFHWPVETVIDTALLETLPEEQRVNGMAEVVKTGLLAGEPVWELDTETQVRRCAAFKAAVCLRDPLERGDRAQLNLGHTFAHGLEAASDYTVGHGRALALGLRAALTLSGLESVARSVEDVLHPRAVRVDREAAWSALLRDKKAVDGRVRLVLLDAPGRPRTDVELAPEVVRAALNSLIE